MKTLLLSVTCCALGTTSSIAQVWVNPSFGDAAAAYNSLPSPIKPQEPTQQNAPAPYDAYDDGIYRPPAKQVIAPIKAQKAISAPTVTPRPSAPHKTIWSGRANLGASLQTGNTEQNAILADVTLKAKISDKQRAQIKAEYNREKDDGTTTEDNRSLDATYDHFFKPKWFYDISAGFEQDDIEELDLRTTLGVGLGYQPFENDAKNLKMVLGPAYLREEFESGTTDNSLAARWSLDYDQKIWEDTLQAFHDHELFIPSDDAGAYLFESKTGLRLPIKNGIIATGEIEFDWNNDPESGITEEDTQYSIKLGYEW